jgi:cell division protein FtsW
MKKNSKLPLHVIFLILLLILSVIGLFFVFEASTVESFNQYGHQHFFIMRQAIWFGVGLIGLLIAYFLPIKVFKKIAPTIYIIGLLLMLLTLVPGIGLELNAAKRWLNLGVTTIQPVEFFKLGLVIFFASWMSRHQKIQSFIAMMALPLLVLLFQPDIGSLLILLTIAAGMFFIAGGEIKKILPFAGVGLLLLIAAIVLSPYRLRRVQTFFNPDSDPLGASFQIRQITLALGNGGWFGLGLGNSQQKYAYIPEVSSDSIFAIVAEEVGFVGSTIILLLFIFLFFIIYQVALNQKDNSFAQLLVVGILIWIAGQTALNLGSVVALVPLTGLPLPLFSYGGSSLVTVLFASGIILKLAKNPEK